jgi:pimeloyl-ACP methyl ester carboxylesterase
MPDATSFGAPPFAPYMLKSAAGKATLDGARVLLRIGTAANTKVRREVVFAGHSQGAHTTLSAAELWKSYAPEVPARGFAVNAPPSGFLEGATFALATPGAFGYFLAMRMWSWRRALDTSQPPIFVGTFAQTEEATFQECQNEGTNPATGALPDLVPANADGVVNPVYLQMARAGVSGWVEPWKTWHVENVPKPKTLGVPVVVWQGAADLTVLPSDTRKYVAELRAGGLDVDLREVAGAKHNDCAMGPVTLPQAAGEDFVAWVRARFGS